MPWMCLEVCDSSSAIDSYIQQFSSNHSYFTALSYEAFQLQADGALVQLNVRNVTPLAERYAYSIYVRVF